MSGLKLLKQKMVCKKCLTKILFLSQAFETKNAKHFLSGQAFETKNAKHFLSGQVFVRKITKAVMVAHSATIISLREIMISLREIIIGLCPIMTKNKYQDFCLILINFKQTIKKKYISIILRVNKKFFKN